MARVQPWDTCPVVQAMVYVDDMEHGYGRMLMFHMLADTDQELRDMARKIGVHQAHHQGDHFDICKSKRAEAVKHGAVEITQRQAAAMRARRRETGALGKPEEAIEWFRTRKSIAQSWP